METLEISESVRAALRLQLDLWSLIPVDRMDPLDCAMLAGVGELKEKTDSLAETGLADFVRSLDKRDACRSENHFGGRDTPIIGDSET